MKMYQLLPAFLGFILLAFVSGAVGQYMQYPTESAGYATTPSPISVGYPTTQTSQVGQTTDQYAQYYTMGPAPNTHITAPQQFNIEGNTPATVYFGYQQQPVPYAQYQSSPTYGQGDTLWIQGSSSWTQYAEVPQGAVVPLLAISPKGGSGYISETHPNGQTYTYNYFFYPASQLTFYADTPGRHTLTFTIPGDPSNPVTIDVTGTYTPPRYYNPPSYYSGYGLGSGFFGDGFIGEGFGGEGFGEGGEFGGEGFGEGGGEGGEGGEGGGGEGGGEGGEH
ncbi:MAG: hypothetical protein LUQ38_02900 [Methanotrichaceae archaeon]|nr:hypothetical protein [Methanotrichaceae archaeon]